MNDVIEKLLLQQQALADFGSFAFRAPDLTSVLHEAAKLCANCLRARFCKVCRYRPEQNDLLIEAGYGWQPDVVGRAVSQADITSPGGRAYITGEPVICTDLTLSDFVLPSFYQQHSIIATANVIIQGTDSTVPYGILEIDHDEPVVYDQRDINFLTSFANVMAEAVAATNHRLLTNHFLEERKLMARELQHRVRNNLHLICSMLTREANRQPADASYRIIANRVMALSTVYDHLLGTDMVRTIPFGEYASRLCDNLGEFQGTHVKLMQGTMEPAPIDLDSATALGIAVTEIISNSYKHAFPTQEGTIGVTVNRRGGAVVVRIEDDGIGIMPGAFANRREGLGLARRLVEQVGGTLALLPSERGSRFEIVVPNGS